MSAGLTEFATTESPSIATQRRSWSFWAPLLIIVLPLGLADLAVCPLMEAIQQSDPSSVIVYSTFGLILAQAGLLSSGLVFGDGPFWKRLLMHWSVAMALLLVWFLGYTISIGGDFNRLTNAWQREMARIICALPAMSLGIQIPLWMGRFGLGWRLAQPVPNSGAEFSSVQKSEQLSIYDLLFATAVVACTLAISRLTPLPPIGGSRTGDQWLLIGLFAASASGLSLIGAVPLVGIFTTRTPLALRWLIALVVVVFLVAGVSVLIYASNFMGLRFNRTGIVGFSAVVGAYSVAMCGGLSLLELAGFRWLRGREQK